METCFAKREATETKEEIFWRKLTAHGIGVHFVSSALKLMVVKDVSQELFFVVQPKSTSHLGILSI